MFCLFCLFVCLFIHLFLIYSWNGCFILDKSQYLKFVKNDYEQNHGSEDYFSNVEKHIGLVYFPGSEGYSKQKRFIGLTFCISFIVRARVV